jgi:hypothetical protein
MWNGQGETRYAYSVLVGETEGKTAFGGNKLRCKDDIKGGLKEIELIYIIYNINFSHPCC